MRTEVKIVTHKPDCDVCKQEGVLVTAYADAKLDIGTWAYLCRKHFAALGCALGTGHGHRLVL